MTVTRDQVRARINASTDTVTDEDIDDALLSANDLITAYLTDQNGVVVTIPQSTLDRVLMRVTVEMINQDQAPSGVLDQQYDFVDGARSVPIRIGRDPMTVAYPLLDRFVTGRYYCS